MISGIEDIDEIFKTTVLNRFCDSSGPSNSKVGLLADDVFHVGNNVCNNFAVGTERRNEFFLHELILSSLSKANLLYKHPDRPV